MTATEENDETLRMAIQKLARRVRSYRGEDLGDGQLAVLVHLNHADGASPAELADRERVTPPSMNRTINALEARGLVTRTRDEHDARRVIVRATDAGRALLGETRRLRSQWFRGRYSALTPEDRDLLLRAAPVLRKLADE